MGLLSASAQPLPTGPSPSPTVLGAGVGIYLGHLLPVGLGVQGRLGEQGWMLFWGNTELIVERVVPDLVGDQGGTQQHDLVEAIQTPQRD